MKNKFIIIGHARSGTSVTQNILRDHPQVSALWDEVDYSPFYDKGLGAYTHEYDKPEEKEKSFGKIFDAVISINETEQTTAYGLKTAVNKPEAAKIVFDTITQRLDNHIKIIIVERENLTSQYGSIMRAIKSGNWHTWQTNLKQTNAKINADKNRFIEYLIKAIKINSTLKQLKNTNAFITVSYEKDILPNRIENFHKVFDFLELPYPDYDLPLKKVAPAPEDYIKNYKELRETEKQIKEDFKAGNIQKWEEMIKPKPLNKMQKARKYGIYYLIKFLKRFE
jgi:hypothetical protein